METYKNKITELFNSYKCKQQSDELKQIPINYQNELVGFLRPVTFNYKLISPEYISLFSTWRKNNPVGFATIFEISDQRTEYWLDNILLNRDDRILFVIYSLSGNPLGHLGFSSFNFEKKSCEIDNVVRGLEGDFKGIMSHALKSIMIWGKNVLNLEDIYLRVLSDNFHAINFYERNGFKKQFDIPLYKIENNNEIKWIEEKNFEDEKPDRFFTYMKFSNDKF